MTIHEAQSAEDVCALVRSTDRVRVVSGGTKAALSSDATLSVRQLNGVIEYEPDEYTFTAWAGTPIRDLQAVLSEHGQDLPFDPPLVAEGATLGGTVAAGISGSGRFRFGGVRDFVIGVHVVNGHGDLVRGGAKVVKNAAGFDLPKLMVGGLGQFGVLIDLTFKVFPAPEASMTLSVDMGQRTAAIAMMKQLAAAPLDLHCLDLQPPGVLWIRVSGLASALSERCQRIEAMTSGAIDIQRHDDDPSIWQDVREFTWIPAELGIAKVPVVPDQIEAVETVLDSIAPETPRRYSVGGNVLWIGYGGDLIFDQLNSLLVDLGRPGLALRGTATTPQFGLANGKEFNERLRVVFDPERKFSDGKC